MSADTRLRELLSEIAPPPEVPEAHTVTARTALRASYHGVEPPRPRARRRASFAWAAAAVSVAAVVVAAALLVPGSSPPVDASLAQIARAARDLEPEQIPAGSFVYSQLEDTDLVSSQVREGGPELLYLLPTTHELWVQGATEQRITTVGTPIFFQTDDEAAYYGGGLDVLDEVGETRISRFGDVPNVLDITKWSDDPATLREQLAAELATEIDPVLDEDIRLVLLLEQLLDPRLNAPPDLRAALIEILGSQDVDTTALADGWVLVSLEYEDPALGTLGQELELDSAGYLRASRSIALEPGPALPVPPGTVTDQSIWSRPYVVDGAGVFPTEG